MALTFTTTLNEIKAHNPCKDGWEKLLAGLGKAEADNEPLHLRDILRINGVQDCIWSFRSFPSEYDRTWRLMAADFAEQVLHIYEKQYPNDNRPRKAIHAARDYANGLIGKEDAFAAASAAYVAGNAARTIRASDAAYASADAVARAAYDAAYVSADASADAVYYASAYSAFATANAASLTASYAARAAADAADVAVFAAYASAAYDSAREKQAEIILKYIS
jgi:hypothetical protein